MLRRVLTPSSLRRRTARAVGARARELAAAHGVGPSARRVRLPAVPAARAGAALGAHALPRGHLGPGLRAHTAYPPGQPREGKCCCRARSDDAVDSALVPRCRSSSTATSRTCCSPHVLPGCVLPIGLRWTRWSRAARAGYATPASAHKRTERTEHLLQAHAVVVNSNYTAGIFAATFTRLHALGVRPEVLYPAAALPPLAHLRAAPSAKDVAALVRAGVVGIPPGARLLLSINRVAWLSCAVAAPPSRTFIW